MIAATCSRPRRSILALLVFCMLPASPGAAQVSVAETWRAFEAVRRGDAEALSKVPQGAIDFKSRDTHGATLLETACAKGSTRLVKALLERGASPNDHPTSSKGFPALSHALRAADPEIVAALLSAGASINYREWTDYSPWQLAFKEQAGEKRPNVDRRCVDLLYATMIERGQADLKIESDGTRLVDEALMWAVMAGDTSWCERFIEQGASVNAVYRGRSIPLSGAVLLGHEAVVELLLKRGADATKGPKPGAILHAACMPRSNARILKRLIDSSPALAEAARQEGRDSPMFAAVMLGNAEILDVLMEAGADPRKIGPSQDALYLAMDAKNPSTVEALLKVGFRSGRLTSVPSKTHLQLAREQASQEDTIENRRILELFEAFEPSR